MVTTDSIYGMARFPTTATDGNHNNNLDDSHDFAPSDEDRTHVGDISESDIPPSDVAAVAARLALDRSTTTSPAIEVHCVCHDRDAAFHGSRYNTNGDGATNTIATTNFKDHFTLLIPSSTVRYRDLQSTARVLEGPDAQFVLEETYEGDDKTKSQVSIRRIHDTSEGVRFLRLTYATVTAFWTGFLFVFCLQVLLFLFLDLAIQSGATSKQGSNWYKAVGAILAFPGFVHGLSCALVIAGAYILDTWRGHYLIRNFTFKNMRQTTVEWIFFFFFLGIPICVLCGSLLAKADNWWEITTLVWFSSVAAFYVVFTANVVWYEMRACWEVTKNKNKKDHDSWFSLIRRSIVSRQMHRYSGRQTNSFLAMGSIKDAEYTDSTSLRNQIESTVEERTSYLTRLTQWKLLHRLGLYRTVKEKDRMFSMDDARDVRPYVTSYTWGLEKVFCRPRNSRFIAIIRGPGALTMSQLRSSMVCSVLGSFLMFMLFFSGLIYLSLDVIFTIFIVAVGLLVAFPSYKNTYKLYKVRKDLMIGHAEGRNAKHWNGPPESPRHDSEAGFGMTDSRENQEESLCVYFQTEQYRITRPTIPFVWTVFVLEVGIFFAYPLGALYSVGNYPLATMFCLFAGISGLRYYVSAAVVLEETGRMDLVDGDTELEQWRNQSRLNEIVGNITASRSLRAWRSVLGSVGFIFLALTLGAVGTEQERMVTEAPKIFLNDFEYVQADSLRYPSCHLSNDLGDSPLTMMVDYAFLAGMAYRGSDITQDDLDGWFGGEAIDQEETVQEFRDAENTSSAVSFKLITFPNFGNFAYVLIRGTQNNWDMLTDAQLWSAAALMQIHRQMLPFGSMWSPVIDQLIQAITAIESKGIDNVSFYRDTTSFVNFIKNQPDDYLGVGVTGHSLGGGLSIITGAQTGVPAVALSGPNAMLSRQSFDPPISREDLNSKTFNIIPERDLVPLVDDVAQNYQEIRCQADFSDVVGCHNAIRSLCEIMYSCGTKGSLDGTYDRPVLCACVTEFGYPEPTRKADATSSRTFAEACGVDQ